LIPSYVQTAALAAISARWKQLFPERKNSKISFTLMLGGMSVLTGGSFPCFFNTVSVLDSFKPDEKNGTTFSSSIYSAH
jgi:hypothetical protein